MPIQHLRAAPKENFLVFLPLQSDQSKRNAILNGLQQLNLIAGPVKRKGCIPDLKM
jgi:hypothetical protein